MSTRGAAYGAVDTSFAPLFFGSRLLLIVAISFSLFFFFEPVVEEARSGNRDIVWAVAGA
jgi:hypothetical protein